MNLYDFEVEFRPVSNVGLLRCYVKLIELNSSVGEGGRGERALDKVLYGEAPP